MLYCSAIFIKVLTVCSKIVILYCEMRILKILLVIILLMFGSVNVVRGEEVLQFQAIEIKGQIQKPQVTYILPRSGLVRIGEDLKDLEPNFEAQLWDNLNRERKENFK